MRWHGPEEDEHVYRKFPHGPLPDVFVIDMRSCRGPNGVNRQNEIGAESQYLRAAQLEWRKRSLKESKAVWKVIALDMPIGLQVTDEKDKLGRVTFEAVANGDGPALGSELEIAQLLSFLRHQRVHNVVWPTADLRRPLHSSPPRDPNKAQFQDFEPLWESVSGPLHAGTFGPNELGNTLGIEVRYMKAPAPGQANLPQSAVMQFSGEVQIDAKSSAMTVHLRDINGVSLCKPTLAPRRA